MFLLSSFFFFYFAGVGVYIIFFPKILISLDYTPSQIGIIFSLVPLMRFLTPFLFLKLFDLTKKIYILSLFVSLLSTLTLFWTIHNFYLLLINITIFGIANGLIMPYVDSLALEKLKESYGKSRLWGSLGFMTISILLARIYSGYKNGLYFYLLIAIAIFIVGIIISTKGKDFNFSRESKESEFDLFKYWNFWISIFLLQVSFGFFYNFFTIYENEHGISLKSVSYLWSVSIICEVCMFAFMDKILRSTNTLKLIQLAIFSAVIRWLLLYLFPSSISISYFTQTLHAFSFALFHSATITYLYKLYRQKKLSMQFYHGISYGLGGFVGSLLAGYFYGKYLFLIASFIALVSMISLSLKIKTNN